MPSIFGMRISASTTGAPSASRLMATAILGLADDTVRHLVTDVAEQFAHPGARRCLVIDDQDLQFRHGSTIVTL